MCVGMQILLLTRTQAVPGRVPGGVPDQGRNHRKGQLR